MRSVSDVRYFGSLRQPVVGKHGHRATASLIFPQPTSSSRLLQDHRSSAPGGVRQVRDMLCCDSSARSTT